MFYKRFYIPFKNLNLLLLLMLCLHSFFVANCDKTNSQEEAETEKTPFVIENLGVRFGPWDSTTNEAGDFLFLDISNFPKIVSEFGAEVVAYDGSIKMLPTIDFIIRDDAPVFAISEGKVSRLFYQEGGEWVIDDYEIGIQSLNDSNYEVGYDHLVNIQVELGDTIVPGDTLGYARPLFEGLGFFEIMINNYETGYSYCPFCLFNPDKLDNYRSQLSRLIQDWETFKNDNTIYNESVFTYPGCLLDSMVTY